MIYVFYAVHVIVSLFLIMVVLLQQGKGADLSVFGGGSTQAAFGARGATTLLHKLTVGGFIAFIITTVGIALLQQHGDTSSVMSGVAAEEQVEEGLPAEAQGATVPADAPEATGGEVPPAQGGATEGSAGGGTAAGGEESGGGDPAPPPGAAGP